MPLLRRIAGPSLITAGTVWCTIWTWWALLPEAVGGEVKPGGELFDLLNVVATVLALVGLTGIHRLQLHRTGRPAAIGIGALWVGALSMAGWALGVFDNYLFFMGGVILLLVALVGFCVVTLRARVVPRSAVIPLIVGLVAFPLMNPDDRRALIALPLGIAWLWLGFAVWFRQRIAKRSFDPITPPPSRTTSQ
jgi:hypothetical protein